MSHSAGGNTLLSSPADDPEHSDVEPSGTEGAVTQQINGDTSSGRGRTGQPLGPGAAGLLTALTPARRRHQVRELLDGSTGSATVEHISSVEVPAVAFNLRHMI